MAIGYLYVDNRKTLTNQISHLQEDIEQLEADYKELNNKFIETLQKIETK
jgi:chromosome segregation ATPase